jgi:hypothetical protein
MKQTPFPNRRRVRLVDDQLQKSLLVALVLMETAAVALAIWMLYQALGRIVDENTYRIHFSNGPSISVQLFIEGLRVLGAMLALNLLALFVADRIWAWYVVRIVGQLDRMMDASSALDLRPQAPISCQHSVLERADDWRAVELRRLAQLREDVRRLPEQLPADVAGQVAAAAVLQTLRDA